MQQLLHHQKLSVGILLKVYFPISCNCLPVCISVGLLGLHFQGMMGGYPGVIYKYFSDGWRKTQHLGFLLPVAQRFTITWYGIGGAGSGNIHRLRT